MRERAAVLALVRLMAERSAARVEAVRNELRSVDWDGLIALLAAQRLVPTLGGLLLDHPEIEVPARVREQIRRTRARTRQIGLLHHGVTHRLCRAFRDRGIPVVPLKGAALADTVYGDIGARQFSDIDLLVPRAELENAVDAAAQHGWQEPELLRAVAVPRLHRELFHEGLPPLEIHWRVHWYEESFTDAALERAQPTDEGWLRLNAPDELACLLLILARDGFAGLRQTLDVAAWWAAHRGDGEIARDISAITASHPALRPAVEAAACHVAAVAGLEDVMPCVRADLSVRQRAALRLANPWRVGSRPQIDATISLIDGLLTPPGDRSAYVRRQLLPPRHSLVRRHPQLHAASGPRMGAARMAHATRVVTRYGFALGTLFRPRSARHTAR